MINLQFGSYIFAHNPRRIELVYSSSLAAHMLPNRGTRAQFLGPRLRVVRCEGEVFDSSADGAAAKLSALSAACGKSAAMLYLPAGERFSAAVSRFSYTAQGDGRVITYAVEFVELESGAGA